MMLNTTGFLQKKYLKVLYHTIFLFSFPIYAIEEYYNFPDETYAGKIVYQEKRKFCIFPMENRSANNKIDYLSAGISSVIKSGLASAIYAYEKNPRKEKIIHPTPGGKYFKQTAQGKILKKNPSYLPLEVVFYEKASHADGGFIAGKKKLCDYTLAGGFNLVNPETVAIEFGILDLYSGRKQTISKHVSERRALQEIKEVDIEIKRFLLHGLTLATLVIDSDQEGALVYLDGVFVGKTPFSRKDIPAGSRKLRISKEGFEPVNAVVMVEKGENRLQYKMEEEKSGSEISITSDPEEADVYLGKKHLGKTPLKNLKVQSGMNRLRISKEGFIDYLKGVDFKQGESSEIAVKLEEGDTTEYYSGLNYLYQEYTYYDFAVYSLYNVLVFFGGYLYNNYQADQTIDNSRYGIGITSPLLTYNTLVTTGQDLTPFYIQLAYEEMRIREIKNRAARYRKQASQSAVGGGVMLVSAFVFLFLDQNDTSLDIGMFFDPATRESRSYFSIRTTF